MSDVTSEVKVGLDIDRGTDVASGKSPPASSCSCGSGLTAVDCCSLDLAHLKRADPSPENRERLLALTNARGRADREAAAALSIAILTEQPTLLEALSALFLIRRSEGNRPAAMALIRRLTILVPHESRFSKYLVDVLVEEKAWAEAESAARNVVLLVPDDALAQETLGMVFSLQQRLPEGEFHLRRALALSKSRSPHRLMLLASNLQSQGQLDASRALYEEASALEPDGLESRLALAGLEWRAAKFDRAAEWLAQIERSGSPANAVRRLKALVAHGRGEFDAALDILQAGLPPNEGLTADNTYLLGQTLDRLGRYDEAFAQFDQANGRHVTLAGDAFNLAQLAWLAQATRAFMTERTFRFLPTAPIAAGAQPLFIVGFPRSGTTMLEQSLSMHRHITAGGELHSLRNTVGVVNRLLASQLGYPFALSELWIGDRQGQIGLLRDHYLNHAKLMLPEPAGAWFTDKALTNELYLGLIHLLFPDSPIIHIVRHPLDVVVSGYANALPHGGYKGGVKEAAQYYLLLLETAEYLRDVIPGLKCMQVKYEDILEDQEHWTRVILGFVGEPFDPGCLSFHENKRYARTVSHQQVREKINTTSKFRYKNYLQHLGPAIDVLAPAIERLGYSI